MRPLPDDAFARAAESMHRLAEHAARSGVRLALEVVNRYETPLLYNTRRALAFLEAVAHDNVYLHLDTFHMSIDESDPVAAIEAALPRLAYLELDQSHRGDALQGSLDLTRLVREAARRGYRGIVGVEAFSRQLLAPDHADAWRSGKSASPTAARSHPTSCRSSATGTPNEVAQAILADDA